MELKKIICFKRFKSFPIRFSRFLIISPVLLFLFFPFVPGSNHCYGQDNISHYKIHLEKVKKGGQKISFYPSRKDWDGILEFSYYSKEYYWPIPPGIFVKDQRSFIEGVEISKTQKGPIGKMEYSYYNPRRKMPGIFPCFRPLIKSNHYYFFNPSISFGRVQGTATLPLGIVFNNPRKLYNTIDEEEIPREIVEFIAEGAGELNRKLLLFSKKPPETIQGSQGQLFCWGIEKNSFLSEAYNSGILELLFKQFETLSPNKERESIHLVFQTGGQEKTRLEKFKSNLIFENGMVINLSGNESHEELLKKTSMALSRYWVCNEILGELYWRDPQEPHSPSHVWIIESLSHYLMYLNLVVPKIYSEPWLKDEFLTLLVKDQKDPENLFKVAVDLYKSDEPNQNRIRNEQRMLSFYDRGVISAFYLDILIREKGYFDDGIIGWLNRFYDFRTREVNSENKDPWGLYLKIQDPEIKTIIDTYVYGEGAIPNDFYLNRIGWDFIQKGEEHRTFLKGGKLYYFAEIGHYVCVKKGNNTLGLESGDVIISINNNEVFNDYDLKELLFVNSDFRREMAVKVLVLRDNNHLVLRGNATKKVKTRHFELMPDSNPYSDEYLLRKKIFQ